MSDIGHNSIVTDDLASRIERAERLMEERKGINDDIKDVFAEAKSLGYDPKLMREAIRVRAMERERFQEQRSVLDSYLAALGVL